MWCWMLLSVATWFTWSVFILTVCMFSGDSELGLRSSSWLSSVASMSSCRLTYWRCLMKRSWNWSPRGWARLMLKIGRPTPDWKGAPWTLILSSGSGRWEKTTYPFHIVGLVRQVVNWQSKLHQCWLGFVCGTPQWLLQPQSLPVKSVALLQSAYSEY